MGVGGGLDWGKEDADVFVAVRGLDSSLLCGWSTYQSSNFVPVTILTFDRSLAYYPRDFPRSVPKGQPNI